MVPECHHILPSGKKCQAVALRGKTLCHHHTPNRKRRAPRPYAVRQTSLLGPLPGITNRQELQYALSRTIQALANNSISVYRAQALITSLQLAAKTL
jgi:hypothetical protein